MLRTRLLSAAIFIPPALWLIAVGGTPYIAALVLVLAVCGAEFAFALRAYHLSPPLTAWSAPLLALAAAADPSGQHGTLGGALSLVLIVQLLAALANARHGGAAAGVAFGLNVGSAVYIGWLGAHLVLLRALPDGLWWTLVIVVSTGLADAGAYFVGRAVGRHKLVGALSPGKTWEGFVGGVALAALTGGLLAALAAAQGAQIALWQGLALGGLVGAVGTLGDLGMSVFKRMGGVKNFSSLLPGHGGFLDRMDSILVGAAVGYYVVIWLFL
jgi:phosphatidate cytidylyltransferase